MHHRLVRLHAVVFAWRHMWSEEALALLLVLLVFTAPASALRFQERSLYMNSARPNDTTSYTVAFRYMSQAAVGSVDMLFCVNPIPYSPCEVPAGLDVSQAVLSNQTGETNFSILSKSANHIVLTRAPQAPTSGDRSSYTFENIKNPTDVGQHFSIRLSSHESTDTTGDEIDFGSVNGQVTDSIMIETQVPPQLIFCVAGEVADNCTDTNKTYYTDMGQLDAKSTLVANSQMAVGTNASGGFAITANGSPPSAGTNVIDAPKTPTKSTPGSNQFGINLVANNAPAVGQNPEGTWANAIPSTDYSIPDRYKYVPGDVVAYSPNVSLMKKFTVSYIINSSDELHAGVYTTTITYIASGRF